MQEFVVSLEAVEAMPGVVAAGLRRRGIGCLSRELGGERL